MKIGLAYLKGSVPGFEDFGNIPTNIVKSNGLVNGVPANKELDGIIIPGGSIVESESLNNDSATGLSKEIKLMAKQGKFILGICSGFQAIANKTDVGCNSPRPTEIEGLGLLDVNFSPLISNDRVVATITDKSFLTNNLIDSTITGFHCHTYGKLDGDAKHIMYSNLKRVNYADDFNKIISASTNEDGNIVGCMVHGCLDENQSLRDNIFKFLDANDEDISDIKSKNSVLLGKIRSEMGIDTNISINEEFNNLKINNTTSKKPHILMIGSTGSDSGKTFITTGIAGALRRNGCRVAVLKIGPDIRDTVPSLYLTKENMEQYASIKIGRLGWKDILQVIYSINKPSNKEITGINGTNYDFVLIEGAMSILTGALNNKVPYSGFEIAKSSKIPMILVSSVSKGGIESATIDVTAHSKFLQNAGINVKAIIINKVYDKNIFENAIPFIVNETGINNIMSLPKVKMDQTSTIPEVKIKLEDFALTALDTVEKYIDIDKIIDMGETCEFNEYESFDEIKKLFNKNFNKYS